MILRERITGKTYLQLATKAFLAGDSVEDVSIGAVAGISAATIIISGAIVAAIGAVIVHITPVAAPIVLGAMALLVTMGTQARRYITSRRNAKAKEGQRILELSIWKIRDEMR